MIVVVINCYNGFDLGVFFGESDDSHEASHYLTGIVYIDT